MNFDRTDRGVDMIRMATRSDAEAICAIYNHYVTDTIVTFEESPVRVGEMSRRIHATTAAWPWLVAEARGQVFGYAYANQWKPRSGYRHTVESTVYLDRSQVGRGAGSSLYASLLEMLRERGVHCAIAGIALPNAASIALHEKFGFRKVAHFRENGIKLGRWIDVGYWQLSC